MCLQGKKSTISTKFLVMKNILIVSIFAVKVHNYSTALVNIWNELGLPGSMFLKILNVHFGQKAIWIYNKHFFEASLDILFSLSLSLSLSLLLRDKRTSIVTNFRNVTQRLSLKLVWPFSPDFLLTNDDKLLLMISRHLVLVLHQGWTAARTIQVHAINHLK